MPDDLASSSLLISSGITLIAVFLGLRQWYEWRARDGEPLRPRPELFLPPRRAPGARGRGDVDPRRRTLLRLAHPPKVAGHANLTFVQVWLAIIGLIIVMLGLALLDWISTRLYARRQHRYLASERRRILRETLAKKPEPIASRRGTALRIDLPLAVPSAVQTGRRSMSAVPIDRF